MSIYAWKEDGKQEWKVGGKDKRVEGGGNEGMKILKGIGRMDRWQ